MKKILISLAFPFYLGMALNVFAGLSIQDWQMWAIAVPSLILASLDKWE